MSDQTRAASLHLLPFTAEVAVPSFGLALVRGTTPNKIAFPAAGASYEFVSWIDADAGERITVQPMIPGVEVLVVAGGAVAAGANLAAAANGRFVTGVLGNLVKLIANEAAAAVGDVISARVLLDEITV